MGREKKERKVSDDRPWNGERERERERERKEKKEEGEQGERRNDRSAVGGGRSQRKEQGSLYINSGYLIHKISYRHRN